ncbi:MAG: sulfurtransferase TusA family protein [Anaerolineae bacterium]
MPITPDQVLDCSGLSCPMPILRTKKGVDAMQVGQVLKMIATDPGSVNDVSAWAKTTGQTLLATEQDGGKYVFYIQKAK